MGKITKAGVFIKEQLHLVTDKESRRELAMMLDALHPTLFTSIEAAMSLIRYWQIKEQGLKVRHRRPKPKKK